jgi:AraC-like DNA-binding protein
MVFYKHDMNSILSNLNMIVAFLCLLMAVHLFWLRLAGVQGNQLSIRLLATCFLTMALQALFLGLKLTWGSHIAAAFQPAMPLLFAPLSYLLFKAAADRDYSLKPMHGLHAVPSVIVVTEMLMGLYIINVDHIILSTLFGYGILLARLALKGKQQFVKGLVSEGSGTDDPLASLYFWLLAFTGYAWFSFVSDCLIYLEVSDGKGVIQSIGLLGAILFKLMLVSTVLLFALQKSPHFDWLYTTLAARGDTLPPADTLKEYARIITMFEAALQDHNLYTQNVLSLKAVADRLGVPARLFSNAVNHTYGESYSKYMNRRRVDMAAKRLRETTDLAMIDVMYDAGFRTKSSFNREFKAITGLSPTQYRTQSHDGR